MNIGIGIDLVSHQEVRDSVLTHGERYLERVYSEPELQACAGRTPRLAARFAVKEATMKALRWGDEPIDWRSIEFRQSAHAAPSLELSGAAAALARQRGLRCFSVSVTQTTTTATAVVLALG